MKRLSVFGLGYVGLSTAVCFASRGFNVLGVDIDSNRVNMINDGRTPIHEPGLKDMLSKMIDSKMLRCTGDCEDAIRNSDVSFVTVGTPAQCNGKVNLSFVKSAARNIGKALQNKQTYHLLVMKSTVPPGTTETLVKYLIEENAGKKCGSSFDICYSPEFLREGSAIEDMLNPDRIVIGESNRRSGDLLEKLYRDFYGEKVPAIVRTEPAVAELVKYANNVFLAMKVSFINTIANVCEKIPNADVEAVAKAIGLDRRIGPLFLKAGLGYGGSCLPKDVRAFTGLCRKLGINSVLVNAAEEVNRLQACKIVNWASDMLGSIRNKRIAVLGLAFKPDTDDVRDAVSIRIIDEFLRKKARVRVYDPQAMKNAQTIFRKKVEYASSAMECIDGADCCVVVTEWNEFKTLKCQDFVEHMRRPILIDGRRIYDPKRFRGKLVFRAIGLGRMANIE